MHVKCPICQKAVTWTDKNRFRPFCSERCRLIDLGQWLDESYRFDAKEAEEIDGEAQANKTVH